MKKIKTLAAAAVVAVSLFSMQGDAMAAEANTISVRGIAKQEVASQCRGTLWQPKLIRYLSEVLLSRK